MMSIVSHSYVEALLLYSGDSLMLIDHFYHVYNIRIMHINTSY